MIIDKNGFVWDERVNSLRCMKERGAETSLFYRAFPAGETHLVLCDNSDRFYYTPFDAIMGMLCTGRQSQRHPIHCVLDY